jgi:hypothetical protein
MSNSNNKASASRWPSLMDSAPSSPSDPRNSTEPTRVLADLGGHKPPGISGGMIAVACCIVAMGIGAGFWATSGAPRTVAAAAPPAVVASAPAPVVARILSTAPASSPAPVVAEAPKPTVAALAPPKVEAAPAAEINVAKISEEPSAPPKAVAAKPIGEHKAAAPVAVAARVKAPSASKAGSDKPRKLAASKPTQKTASVKQPRQPVNVVATRGRAHAPDKPGSTIVTRARDDKRREAGSAAPAARKYTDPDTDLLAAMLRRNGGGPQ